MEAAERDLEFYRERLNKVSQKEAELEVKLEKVRNITETNEKTLKDLISEQEQLAAQLSTRDLNVEKIEMAIAHVERLQMQLEDHLSTERQTIEAFAAAGKVSDKVPLWERAAAVAITFSVLVATIASVRKYLNKRK